MNKSPILIGMILCVAVLGIARYCLFLGDQQMPLQVVPGGAGAQSPEVPEHTSVELQQPVTGREIDSVPQWPPPISPEAEQSPQAEIEELRELREQLQRESELTILAARNGWDRLYEKVPKAELETKQVALDREILAEVQPLFDSLFSNGRVTAYSSMPRYEIGSLYQIKVEGGGKGPFIKATLPREEYPEVYAKKDLSLWLKFRIAKL